MERAKASDARSEGIFAPRKRPTKAELEALARDESGNVTAIAERLGCTRQSVYTWVYQHGLQQLVGVETKADRAAARAAAEPGRVVATIKVDGELWKTVRIAGVKEDRTTSSIVEEALRAFFEGRQS